MSNSGSSNKYSYIVGRSIDYHSADIAVDMSVDMLTDTSRSLYRSTSDNMSTDTSVECRPIHRSAVGRYVNRYIDHAVHKIHIILFFLVFGDKKTSLDDKFVGDKIPRWRADPADNLPRLELSNPGN